MDYSCLEWPHTSNTSSYLIDMMARHNKPRHSSMEQNRLPRCSPSHADWNWGFSAKTAASQNSESAHVPNLQHCNNVINYILPSPTAQQDVNEVQLGTVDSVYTRIHRIHLELQIEHNSTNQNKYEGIRDGVRLWCYEVLITWRTATTQNYHAW